MANLVIANSTNQNNATKLTIKKNAEAWTFTVDDNQLQIDNNDTATGGISIYAGDASGKNAFAVGANVASGNYSYAEGEETVASGNYSHTQNNGTIAEGENQTAIGKFNINDTNSAFIIGNGDNTNNRSNAYSIDWNGNSVQAGTVTAPTFIGDLDGSASRVNNELSINGLTYNGSVAQDVGIIKPEYGGTGNYTGRILIGEAGMPGAQATSEGHMTSASGDYSHAEGQYTQSSGMGAHAEGHQQQIVFSLTNALDLSDNTNPVILEGVYGVHTFEGNFSDIEVGDKFCHDQYTITSISDQGITIEPSMGILNNISNVYVIFKQGAKGDYSHSEGFNTQANGDYSHSENEYTIAYGKSSHAEGAFTMAYGDYSHAEGNGDSWVIDTITGDASATTYILPAANNSIKPGEIVKYNNIYAKITEYDATVPSITVDQTLSDVALTEAPITIYTLSASGNNSHAEGNITVASGDYSHAEGQYTEASGGCSHAENGGTVASGDCSHAEGICTIASGECSHAEGNSSEANGTGSHAEGDSAKAYGNYSHAENNAVAYGDYSHAEGVSTIAVGEAAHAEGGGAGGEIAVQISSAPETRAIALATTTYILSSANSNILANQIIQYENNVARIVEYDPTVPSITVTGSLSDTILSNAYAKIYKYGALGHFSHSEGHQTIAYGNYSHAEGDHSEANGNYSHAEGVSITTGDYSHAEGDSTANGAYSHAEGNSTSNGNYSHAEGNSTANGAYSHAEGKSTGATGQYSHTEGNFTRTGDEAIGAHAEGSNSNAYGSYSHAEGYDTYAYGDGAHTEGKYTFAQGNYSHAEGKGAYGIVYRDEAPYIYLTGSANATTYTIDVSNSDLQEIRVHSYIILDEGRINNNLAYNTRDVRLIRITALNAAAGTLTVESTLSTTAITSKGYQYTNGGISFGLYSHSEGEQCSAIGQGSHAEGIKTVALNNYSHTEGHSTVANGNYAHAEGFITEANGTGSHAEGYYAKAYGNYSHAENNAVAWGNYSHAEGEMDSTTITISGSANTTTYNLPAKAFSYTVANASGTNNYGFSENSNGFWESQNQGINDSYALCTVTLTVTATTDIVFDVINYAESNYDFALFSNLNTTLAASNAEDTSNVYQSFKSTQFHQSTIQQVTYSDVAAGTHTIQIKFIKDSSQHKNYDSVQFRIPDDFNIVRNSLGKRVSYNGINAVVTSYNASTRTITFNKTLSSTALSNKTISLYSNAYGLGSHVGGYDTTAYGSYQTVIGKSNKTDNSSAFIIGNGTPDNYSNALTVGWDGTVTASKVYGAVWNDYAEYRNQIEIIEPGYCVASQDNGQVYKTNEKFQSCDGIVSDTFGFAIGETKNCQTPIAVAGRVLAYCEGNKYDYHAGDTVCAGPNGKVCKMTREEICKWPDRIVGIVSEIPEYKTWGSGNIKVNGRIWIKIK